MKERQKLVSKLCMHGQEQNNAHSKHGHKAVVGFLINTQVQSHALLRRGFALQCLSLYNYSAKCIVMMILADHLASYGYVTFNSAVYINM